MRGHFYRGSQDKEETTKTAESKRMFKNIKSTGTILLTGTLASSITYRPPNPENEMNVMKSPTLFDLTIGFVGIDIIHDLRDIRSQYRTVKLSLSGLLTVVLRIAS